MKRIELFANNSVETEIVRALEENIKDFYYTLVPEIHGKGKTKYRLGTTTWPETNFLLITYLEDDDVEILKNVVIEVKKRFPQEGIKLFIVTSVELAQ